MTVSKQLSPVIKLLTSYSSDVKNNFIFFCKMNPDLIDNTAYASLQTLAIDAQTAYSANPSNLYITNPDDTTTQISGIDSVPPFPGR